MNKILSPDPRFSFWTRHAKEIEQVVIREVFAENVYRVHREMLEHSGVVVDVGANIGAFSVYCAGLADCRMIAFEPEPHNFELLRKNLELNGVEDRVTVDPRALGGKRGAVGITDSGGGSRVVPIEDATDHHAAEAEMVTLADAWKEHGLEEVDVLKVDVEGSEVPLITAAPRKLMEKIRYAAIEYDQYSKGFGRLVEKLSETHKVETLGSHKRGAYVYAQRY